MSSCFSRKSANVLITKLLNAYGSLESLVEIMEARNGALKSVRDVGRYIC